MKNLTITFICAFMISTFSISSWAQEAKEFNTKKTEINIGVSNVFAKNNIIYQYYYFDNDYYLQYIYSDYFRKPELVVGLKFHTKKGAFRLATNFNYNNNTTKDNTNNNDTFYYKTFSTRLNLGYEWHNTYSRVVFLYGFDISTSYSRTYNKNEYMGNYGQVSNEATLNEIIVGINPLIGVNFYITPNLSIGTEVKFTAEYVSGKTISESSGLSNADETESSGFRTHFGPLGYFSLNFHF